MSNDNHHLSRRGSTATILHQHPQQSRDLNNYQNYQENKNHQLPYLVLRRSSCDPENNNNIINNDPVTSYTTTALTTEWKGSFNSLFQINNDILIYFPLQFFSLQRELQSKEPSLNLTGSSRKYANSFPPPKFVGIKLVCCERGLAWHLTRILPRPDLIKNILILLVKPAWCLVVLRLLRLVLAIWCNWRCGVIAVVIRS